MEPLLDLAGASRLLGMKPEKLYEYCRPRCRRRQSIPIPVVKVGRTMLFNPASLRTWVEKLEANQTA